ncbi:MAG: hypothetical protein RLZ98_893 [Pseudomonadota bacterium]|jgi:small ligand-binding sensory domain FIST
MPDYAIAFAADDTPDALAEACASELATAKGHTVGFIYVTDRIAAAYPEILARLKKRTGIETWVGTVGLGICATGQTCFGKPGIAAMTARWRPDAVQLLPSLDRESDVAELDEPAFLASLGIVHADPRNAHTFRIVSALSERFGTFLVGGLTAGRSAFPQVSGEVTEGGVSGLLLGGNLGVVAGLSQGCSPIGPTHRITRGSGNVLMTLDDMPALEVLREEVGVADGADILPWLGDVHVALPVSGHDAGDYLVRNLAGIDPKHDAVVIAERISAGDRITFVRRNAESALKDIDRMLTDLKARSTAPPKAGLYFSCCARGPNLFDNEQQELDAIRDALGDIPLVGFFGNGEISHDRIYGYTGVLALFT